MAVSYRGAAAFGMVHIPVGRYTATQDNGIHFNQLISDKESAFAQSRSVWQTLLMWAGILTIARNTVSKCFLSLFTRGGPLGNRPPLVKHSEPVSADFVRAAHMGGFFV